VIRKKVSKRKEQGRMVRGMEKEMKKENVKENN
jgi:hypothetical protein